MLFIILTQALLMLPLKGTDGQEIVFDPLGVTSPCSQGLRSGADTLTLTGTVGRNFSALVNSGWFTSVTISVFPSPLTRLCDIFIGPDGFFCTPTSTDACYCHHINTTTGSAHFVVNYTAQEDFSGRVIEAQWNHQNGSVVHSHNTITLPTIYDVNKASMTIRVNDEPTKQITAHFEVNVVPNKNNTVQLCCINTASPCYPRMLLNGQVFENQISNCVNFTVFQPDKYTANVTSLYSVCSTSDYITAGVGVITSVEQRTGGQEIVFDPLRLISPCSRGLRSGTDKFILTGTVGRNYSALVSSGWLTFVRIQITVVSSQWMEICDIVIGRDGVFCDPSSTKTCYCSHINSTTGSAHFVVNYTAQEEFSGGVVRAQWQNQNGSVVYSVNTVTLPAIYDVNKASLTLTVNGVPAKQTSDSIEIHLVSNKNNAVQVCCINSASPCYPRMLFNGQVFENQPNCVTGTVFAPNVNYTADVTLSYSVCPQIDYIPAGSGVITTVEENVWQGKSTRQEVTNE